MNKMPMTHNHRRHTNAFHIIMRKVEPPVSTVITRDVRDSIENILQMRVGVQLHRWLRDQ